MFLYQGVTKVLLCHRREHGRSNGGRGLKDQTFSLGGRPVIHSRVGIRNVGISSAAGK